jgi:uracil phosphoribosyltransferase
MFILAQKPSVADIFLAELRDHQVQKEPLRFRKNMERVGEILAYEISKTFSYTQEIISTPLADTEVSFLKDKVVLATILRAGIPFHQGFLNFYDKAENCFIGSFRKITDEHGGFEIQGDYVASPELTGKQLILADPMLATGKSIVAAIQSLSEYGKPKKIHVAAIISSREGVNFVKNNFPEVSLWVGAVDEELNEKSYIIPGLGDAGDLAFGMKK